MFHQTFLFLGQLWQLFEVSQLLEFLRYICHSVFIQLLDGVCPSLEWIQITESDLWNFAIIQVLPFRNKPKDLNPAYKTGLDFWNGFGIKKKILPVRHIFSWYKQFRGILNIAFPEPVCHLWDVILTVLSDGESQHKFVNNEQHYTEHICTL